MNFHNRIKMNVKSKRFVEDERPKEKIPKKDKFDTVELNNKEKFYFEKVFRYLCSLEKEESSDDNTKEKKYKNIKGKTATNQLKKKNPKNIGKKKINESSLKNAQPKNSIKKFNEDINLDTESSLSEDSSEKKEKHEENYLYLYKNPEKDEEILRKERFGKKALRKMLKKLTGKYSKEDIDLMILEVDIDLNGYISFDEYKRMYKNCIIDKREKKPKKLFTLIQFLMFDKENKGYITEEDTLEILSLRNNNGLENAIDDIFSIEIKDERGNITRTKDKKDFINYEEFDERMHSLSLRKRALLMNPKKIYSDKLREEALKNAKLKFDF